ncbi:MAG: tyrosine-type recombinase/integrase [Zoogloea sp.]|nr:tyrosine-type recombinase/integrase [Zoogloea sp.]
MPVAKTARERLTLEAWQAIADYALKHMPPWVHRMLVIALITGLRRGDLVRLQFDDIRDDHLQLCLQKTGILLRLPLALRMEAIDMSLHDAVEACRGYSRGTVFLLRKSTGAQLSPDSLSARFETAREAVFGKYTGEGKPSSLHECRSLAERLYRDQGINTQRLLGHAHQRMTDVYNSERGLTGGQWKTLEL